MTLSGERKMSLPQLSYATVLRLALPMVVSRMTQTIVSASDLAMVASLGTASIAATATGSGNSFLLLIFPLGTVFLVQSFSSQYFGKGDRHSARRFGWYGLLIALGTQLLCIVAWPLVQPAVALLPADSQVQMLMSEYIRLRLLSGGAAIGIEALGSYYSGLGRTLPAMVVNLIAMALNILLNWIFIYGHLGAPAMGVGGAALASSISTGVAFALFFGLFIFEGRGPRAVQLKANELLRLLRFGLPSGLNWFFEYVAFLFFLNFVVGRLGTASLAAMNSVLQINQVSFMPAFGLSSAGAVLVGQALGAQSLPQAKQAVRLTLVLNCIWMGAVGLACLAMPRFLLYLLKPDDVTEADLFMSLAVNMLRISVAWQLFDAVSMTLSEALRAAGDTVFPLVARLAIAWLVFVPGSYISVRFWGGSEMVATVWLVAYLVLLSVALVWRFRAGAWQSLALIQRPEGSDASTW